MTVEGANLQNFMMQVINKSYSNQGEALVQLLEALNKAQRAQGEPLANVANVNAVDVKV